MATLTSSRAGSGDQARYTAVGDVVETIKYTMTGTASATDTLQLCKVLNGARVVSINAWADTATVTYSVGDGDNSGKFMTTASSIQTNAATSIGVLSTFRSINVAGGLCYSYSAADTIDLRFDAAGGATGVIVYAVIQLHYDGQESV
jgi:hypothetical protein